MTAHRGLHPLDAGILLGYWLAELDAEREGAVEAHLFECTSCSDRLAELAAMAGGTRELVRRGLIAAVVSGEFITRLRDRGLRVREYRVERGGSVNCTVAPDDDVVIGRLSGGLEGIERLDFVSRDASGLIRERLSDVPFDPRAGELVFTTHLPTLRGFGSTTLRVELVAVGADREEVIGEYLFRHEPWQA